MRIGEPALTRCNSGQALAETALLLPLLLAIVLNVVNFGYFFLVALNVATAPRSGVAYSIMGDTTPGGAATGMPAAGPSTDPKTVSYLTYQDMTGALHNPTSAGVQVCSQYLGLNNPGSATQTAKCSTFGTYASPPGCSAPGCSDPESPVFVLNRVDVAYIFNALIPGRVFNIALMPVSICTAGGVCTFHRQVSMRAMN